MVRERSENGVTSKSKRPRRSRSAARKSPQVAARGSLCGGCSCGKIRYQLDPSGQILTTICYCRDCQRESGSAFTSNLVVRTNAFELTRGKLKFYERVADSGRKIRHGFCAKCGAAVANFAVAFPVVAVRAGSLDEPALFKPLFNIFLASAPPSAPMLKTIPGYDRQMTQ